MPAPTVSAFHACVLPSRSLSSLHSSVIALLFGRADICSSCVDEGAGTLLRGGFWDVRTAPSSYCPVSSARLALLSAS